MFHDILTAILLGLVEGLTEFIPVSSTAHLILSRMALGLEGEVWNSFIVLIQLGAVLSVVVLYFQRLWGVLIGLPSDPAARRFALTVTAAFIPAVVIGSLLYSLIKRVLFESPQLICGSLIVGGVILLVLERMAPRVQHREAMHLPFSTAVAIGLCQCLAMIPGVSRSGATIVGGVMLGVDKRAAAEFSFYLAIPTMVGAFAKDFWESRHTIMLGNHLELIALGFVVSFLSGLVVVRVLLDFVSRRGLAPFGIWRIAVGALGLAALYLH